jgi:hypothetical protein
MLKEKLTAGKPAAKTILKILCSPPGDLHHTYWEAFLERMAGLATLGICGDELVHCYRVINEDDPLKFCFWIDEQLGLLERLQGIPVLHNDILKLILHNKKTGPFPNTIDLDALEHWVTKAIPATVMADPCPSELPTSEVTIRCLLIAALLKHNPTIEHYLDTQAIPGEETKWGIRALWNHQQKAIAAAAATGTPLDNRVVRLAFVMLCGVRQMAALQAFMASVPAK